jgi:hypothetical protein
MSLVQLTEGACKQQHSGNLYAQKADSERNFRRLSKKRRLLSEINLLYLDRNMQSNKKEIFYFILFCFILTMHGSCLSCLATLQFPKLT